jgi:hypothetical protein
MTRLLQFIERKPLGLCFLALTLSALVIGLHSVPSYTGPWIPSAFDWGTAAACCIALGIALLALINLIRAERRSYSSTKIGLGVLVLFFAFAPLVLLALKLVGLYGREQRARSHQHAAFTGRGIASLFHSGITGPRQ